jgi:putative ABC transport system permease protein
MSSTTANFDPMTWPLDGISALAYMTPTNLLRLWRARLSSRTMLVQECLAVLGIAVGVALLFASQVASTSLTGSVQQLTNEIIGHSQQLQVEARGPGGIDEHLLGQLTRLPGVRSALPVLEQPATVIGPSGSRAVDLLGTTPQFASDSGPLLRRFSGRQLAHLHAIALPQPLVEDIGADDLQDVKIQVGAKIVRTYLGASLDEREIGALAQSPVAIATVAYAQQLAGMTGRVTRIFVRPLAGREQQVRVELNRLAAQDHFNVEPADFDSKLFAVASTPETQSESLFSVISALVGFLFALTAILLTVPRRRRVIEELWPYGAGYGITLEMLLLDAAVLGVLGCALGLVLGDLLSIAAFHRAPGYLASAFPVGNSRIVSLQSVVLAVAAGGASAVGGVLWPMRAVLLGPSGERSRRSWAVIRVVLGVSCLGATGAILLLRPQDAFLGSATLVIALVSLMPFAFQLVLKTFERLQRLAIGGAATELAADQLSSPRVRVRALAIAATSAIAVFGTVSIGGAQISLRRGLLASADAIDASADVWVSPSGESSVLATTPFKETATAAITRLRGVATLGVYRGSFLDWGTRRLWVLAPPANSKDPIPLGQLVAGRLRRATERVREGGWVVLSEALAHEHHLQVGDTFTLPAPEPRRVRVAALSTNLGWPPGAIILSAAEYARAWASSAPSGYEIQTDSGASPETVRHLIQQTLGPQTGLAVETSAERQARHHALINQGLARITQIKLLVLIAGVLALAGAMSSLIWQRRERIAAIRVQGYSPLILWQWLCCESALMLGTGCCMGAVFGIAGQLLLSHALAAVTGFPISLGVETTVAALSFLWVGVVAFAIVAVPGYLAVHVSPRAASAAQ